MASHLPQPKPGKSISQQFQEGITFVIIGSFIIHYIGMFFEFLFSPLMSSGNPEDIEEKILEKIEQKQNDREIKRILYKRIVNDPMYQFKLRFIKEPDKYNNDPNNNLYNEWFKEWKNGNVIDSHLRWAPSVYERPDKIARNFIDYLKIQWDLHKNTVFKKWIFYDTINKYYPEFTPSEKGLEKDLAHYELEVNESELQSELQYEIQKFGLPPDIAQYFIEKDIPAEELEQTAVFMKQLIEKGIRSDICIYTYENNITNVQVAHVINEFVKATSLPARVGFAFIKQEVNKDDVNKIMETLNFTIETYGKSIFDYIEGTEKTAYDDLIDGCLEEAKLKNAAKNFRSQK